MNDPCIYWVKKVWQISHSALSGNFYHFRRNPLSNNRSLRIMKVEIKSTKYDIISKTIGNGTYNRLAQVTYPNTNLSIISLPSQILFFLIQTQMSLMPCGYALHRVGILTCTGNLQVLRIQLA